MRVERVASAVACWFVLGMLAMPALAERVPRVKRSDAARVASVATVGTAITISGDLTTQTAQDLAQSLVGSGVTVSNVTAHCNASAAGTFTATAASGIGISSGIILSSGEIRNTIGPNDESGSTGYAGQEGDNDLDSLIPGYETHDACVLEFDFVPQSPVVTFRYAFASDEYNEFVGSSFNDVFGFFVNGQNCAVINAFPVAVNTVNNTFNPEYYVDNSNGGYGGNADSAPYDNQMDGFTRVLTCSSTVKPNQSNHIKLAIADAGDSILDSNVYIGSQSLTSVDYSVASLPTVQNSSANGASTAYYVVEVMNTGSKDDTYTASIGTTAWEAKFSDSQAKTTTIGPLKPLQKGYLYVEVTVPKAASTDEKDVATVTVTSQASGSVSDTSTMTTTSKGTNCNFIRLTPTYYIPGVPMDIRIHAYPTCVASGTYDLEDTPPVGWSVTKVSNGGVFSAGKVSWGDLPNSEAVISYTVTPPISASGTGTFAGAAAAGGKSFTVGGAIKSDAGEAYHPGDLNANWGISLPEFTSYGAVWLSGKEWVNGWPCTIDFVVKAAELWAKNATYHYDADAGVCPKCWVSNAALSSPKLGAARAPAAGATHNRTVGSSYVPGEKLAVTLTVTPPAGTTVYAVEENPPAGWVVSDISSSDGHKGGYDGINKKIKWGIYNDGNGRTFTYSLTPPLSATGTKVLSGAASFNGSPSTPDDSALSAGAVAWTAAITTKAFTKSISYKGMKGTLSFKITGEADAAAVANAVSASGWITVNTAKLKLSKGKGTVPFQITANGGITERSGAIYVGTARFDVTQSPTPCSVKAVTTTTKKIPASGGELSLAVDVYPDVCSWKVESMKIVSVDTDLFLNQGTFPEVGETVTGDQTVAGTVTENVTHKTRTVQVKVSTLDGKSKKTVTVSQVK